MLLLSLLQAWVWEVLLTKGNVQRWAIQLNAESQPIIVLRSMNAGLNINPTYNAGMTTNVSVDTVTLDSVPDFHTNQILLKYYWRKNHHYHHHLWYRLWFSVVQPFSDFLRRKFEVETSNFSQLNFKVDLVHNGLEWFIFINMFIVLLVITIWWNEGIEEGKYVWINSRSFSLQKIILFSNKTCM